VTVYLVRHAVAVGRSSWEREDLLRPLTKRGRRQARGLVGLLSGCGIARVLSSPAVRCLDTVAPLAAELGLDVEEAAELQEGTDPEHALGLARRLAAEGAAPDGTSVVLCTHGDLVPEVVRLLARDGMRWDGDLRFAKGSTWVLEWDGGRCVAGRYQPPCG
jgi:8-oxo-dGTP diphosphatase